MNCEVYDKSTGIEWDWYNKDGNFDWYKEDVDHDYVDEMFNNFSKFDKLNY